MFLQLSVKMHTMSPYFLIYHVKDLVTPLLYLVVSDVANFGAIFSHLFEQIPLLGLVFFHESGYLLLSRDLATLSSAAGQLLTRPRWAQISQVNF